MGTGQRAEPSQKATAGHRVDKPDSGLGEHVGEHAITALCVDRACLHEVDLHIHLFIHL